MGTAAVADITAFADHVSLCDTLAKAHARAVLAMMEVMSPGSVIMTDPDFIVVAVQAIPVVVIDDLHHLTAACGTNLRSHRHIEIVGEVLEAPMADDRTITLAAE